VNRSIKKFLARVRRTKEAAGYTLRDLAVDCETNKDTLSNAITGKSQMSLELALELSKVLDIDISDEHVRVDAN